MKVSITKTNAFSPLELSQRGLQVGLLSSSSKKETTGFFKADKASNRAHEARLNTPLPSRLPRTHQTLPMPALPPAPTGSRQPLQPAPLSPQPAPAPTRSPRWRTAELNTAHTTRATANLQIRYRRRPAWASRSRSSRTCPWSAAAPGPSAPTWLRQWKARA